MDFPTGLYSRVAQLATHLAASGYTHILLPPACRGASNGAGYDLYNNYDIGQTSAVRGGTADELRQCIAVCHANGLQVLVDFVIHQYDGAPGGNYQYPASGGKAAGRFPKIPNCFVGAPPRVPIDPVWNIEGDYGFGDMVSVVHNPQKYMWNGIIAACGWLKRALGFDGFRIDDVKGMYAPFIHALLTSKDTADMWAFAEDFEGDPQQLWNWVNSAWSQMQGRCSALDFTFHWHMQDILDNGYPMSHFQALLQTDPLHSVPFVDSPDTDTSPGEQIINSKLLAYAIMCACEGAPQIYYRDWSTDENCYGLGKYIDNLAWIHRNLAVGSSQYHYPNGSVMVINRTGWPGLLMAVNKDTWNSYVVSVPTSFGPNTHLHDYTGHHGDIWTDDRGWATFRVPSNANSAGHSYIAFGPAGITGAGLPSAIRTVQEFEGADDLITGTVSPGAITDLGQIFVAAGSRISTSITGMSSIQVVDLDGGLVDSTVPTDGWYTLKAVGGKENAAPVSFTATVNYLAPKNV